MEGVSGRYRPSSSTLMVVDAVLAERAKRAKSSQSSVGDGNIRRRSFAASSSGTNTRARAVKRWRKRAVAA